MSVIYLVGGLVAIVYFRRNIGLSIIPIDEVIFFRGVKKPPTSYGYPMKSRLLSHEIISVLRVPWLKSSVFRPMFVHPSSGGGVPSVEPPHGKFRGPSGQGGLPEDHGKNRGKIHGTIPWKVYNLKIMGKTWEKPGKNLGKSYIVLQLPSFISHWRHELNWIYSQRTIGVFAVYYPNKPSIARKFVIKIRLCSHYYPQQTIQGNWTI